MFTTPIPADFSERMHGIQGMDADALTQALDSTPSVAIRLNVRKQPASGDIGYAGLAPVSWCPDGFYLPDRPVFTLNPLLHAGTFYVQDPSSMIHQQVVRQLAARLGDVPLSLLDFCAAPGGKTTAMMNGLPDHSVVVANEYVPARGKILRENLEKWGYPGVITTGAAATDYAALPEVFDIVAIDAPCSGEGMMRKEEEARRQWTPKLVEECAALQRDILTDIVDTLRPGGFLIYSTCTFNLEEDELNSRFICEELGLEPVDIGSLDLKGIGNAGKALLPDVSALRFMPHLTRGEGLYLSIFRKPGHHCPYLENEGAPAAASARKPRQKGKATKAAMNTAAQLSDENVKVLGNWFQPEWNMRFERHDNLITTLPAEALPLLTQLRKAGIRITGAGLPAAEIKGRDIVPDSRIVLSSAYRRPTFPEVELSRDEALGYLRRETLGLPDGTPKGFVTVSFSGQPLGLVKNLGNRANNLFPPAWRIRI